MIRLYGGAWIDVVGIAYRKPLARQFVEAAFLAEIDGRLFGVVARPEPDNPHEPNAMAVHGFVGQDRTRKAWHIGYLPAEIAADLADRPIRLALANGYLSDAGYVDIELVIFGQRAVEDVLATFDKDARRAWLRDLCMPGLKILAHIAAADGATGEAELSAMAGFARRVAALAATAIDADVVVKAVHDAVSMAPSEQAVKANFKRLSGDDEAVAILLDVAAKLALVDGVTAGEGAALKLVLALEAKARPGLAP